jgi:hypothetical protein
MVCAHKMYQIDTMDREGLNCPHCRTEIDTSDIDEFNAYTKATALWGMCEGERQICGYCDAEFTSAFDLYTHLTTTCPRAIIKCAHQECVVRIAREQMPDHELRCRHMQKARCPTRRVRCPVCNSKCRYSERREKHEACLVEMARQSDDVYAEYCAIIHKRNATATKSLAMKSFMYG